MNIRDLQYLVALSEHKHFGNAAEACHVSQPTLSTQIKKLEDELGAPLVERDNKTVILTDLGLDVVTRSQQILAGVDEIKQIAKQAANPESGTLRLGLIPTIAPYLLPYAVKALKSAFPDLNLFLHEAQTHELIERLKSGNLDAAIMALPVNDDRLDSIPMYSESFFAALPLGHPLAKQKTIEVNDLTDQALMLLEDGHCLRDQALEICHHVGIKETQGFRATSLETLRQMVVSGAGITLLPTLAAETQLCQDGVDIHIVPFASPAPKREVGIFYRPSSPNIALYQSIAKSINQRLPKGLKEHLTIID